MTRAPITGRLDQLLAAHPGREDVAAAIERQLLQLVAEGWSTLIEACADGLASGAADALRAATPAMPGTELLLPRLAAALSPVTLLGLRPGCDAMLALLLAHPLAQQREQVLDALRDGPDETTLVAICASWSRRMLVAALGAIDGVSQRDRLALQERLLALRGELGEMAEAEVEGTGPDDLGEALHAASHRRASEILAERAGVSTAVVETAITRRDRRRLLALCKAAGAGPDEAVALQIQLARICPSEL